MIDGKMLAQKYAKTKDANIDAEGESRQGYGDPKAKMSYHEECMKEFIHAIHAKEPHAAHAAMVKYVKGEPMRKDSDARTEMEEDEYQKPSSEEYAKYYRKAHFRD